MERARAADISALLRHRRDTSPANKSLSDEKVSGGRYAGQDRSKVFRTVSSEFEASAKTQRILVKYQAEDSLARSFAKKSSGGADMAAEKLLVAAEPANPQATRSFVVTYHVNGHAEGQTFSTLEEAQAAYSKLEGGKWACRLYNNGIIVHQYGDGGMDRASWQMLQDFADAQAGEGQPSPSLGRGRASSLGRARIHRPELNKLRGLIVLRLDGCHQVCPVHLDCADTLVHRFQACLRGWSCRPCKF